MSLYFGLKERTVGYSFQTTCYEQFQCILVLDGRVDLLAGPESLAVGPGRLIRLPTVSAFTLSCTEGGYRGIGVGVIPDERGGLAEPFSSSAGQPATAIPARPELLSLGEWLDREIRQPRSRELTEHLAWAFLHAGLEEQAQPTPPAAAQWVERSAWLIRQSIRTPQRLESLLGRIGLGYRQLSRHFEEKMGLGPKAFQMQCRLDEAMRLLRCTHMGLSEVALEVGFASQQHFTTAFRRRYGCSPGAWRRNNIR